MSRGPGSRCGLAQEKAPRDEKRPPKAPDQPRAQANGGGVGPAEGDPNDMGFFVDPAPSQRTKRPNPSAASNGVGAQNGDGKKVRASDRRREDGRAPEPHGPKDTHTSLKQGAQAVGLVVGTLQCVRGPEMGVVLNLGNGSFTVGRGRDNEMVLKDIAASRKHLRLEVSGQRVRLVDLGSGNGTKVNGNRASEVDLRHGDTIEIGGSMLVFAEEGKHAPAPEPTRDEAQARVVAAADQLARELSERLRFGSDGPPGDFADGHVAKTRALRTADARAAVQKIAQEAQAQEQQQKKQAANDRLWSETFTNMPLSAVVPADHSLQGGGGRAEAPTVEPPRQRRGPVAAPSLRSIPPAGTVNGQRNFTEDSVLQEFSESGPRGTSFLTSVLLSAGVVVMVGAFGLGVWVIFFKEPSPKSTAEVAGSIAAEREAEYGIAIRRAQDAYVRQDWLAVREYAVAALQVKPKDVMATSYKRDADLKLEEALAAAARQALPAPVEVPPQGVVSAQVSPPEVPQVVGGSVATPKIPQLQASKPAAPTLSEGYWKAQYARIIDAFRSKDDETGCRLIDRFSERAPAESEWKRKADKLYDSKKCGG